jgi:hypothetical protein
VCLAPTHRASQHIAGVMYQCVICGILLLRHKGLLAGSVLG